MSNVVFLSHGGGPLPLLGEPGHQKIIDFYKEYGKDKQPKVIVVISAHYESDDVKVIYNHPQKLLFDYYGFPESAYKYEYNPPINYHYGETILSTLRYKGIKASESTRGFDHGVFVPLLLMFPKADIPVIQISLKKGLDPLTHIEIGKALGQFKDALFIGSGSSYHNLNAYLSKSKEDEQKNEDFHDELRLLLTSDMDEQEREKQLINWENLPNARFIHPREEHLIPLLVCYGIKQQKGKIVFDDHIFGKRNICVEW